MELMAEKLFYWGYNCSLGGYFIVSAENTAA